MARRKAENGREGDTTVGITVDARNALAAYLATKHNPVMRDVVTALTFKFLTLPDPVKSAALETVDQDMELQYADVLETMAQELRGRWEQRHGVQRQGTRSGKATKNGTPAPAPQPAPDARKRPA